MLVTAAACHGGSGGSESEDINPEPMPGPVILVVKNHGYYDVDVFALPSDAGGRAVRVGSVPGLGTQQLTIQPRDLQPGGVLQVQVHAFGTNRTWNSRPLSIQMGTSALLEVNMDANGGMNRSVLVPISEPPGG
jgi:hypothetical protein